MWGFLIVAATIAAIIFLARLCRADRRAARRARRAARSADMARPVAQAIPAQPLGSAVPLNRSARLVCPSNISLEGTPCISAKEALPQNPVSFWPGSDSPIDWDYRNLGEQPHILIAGATGSGKSVFLNNLIYNLMSAPGNTEFVYIDLKRVELSDYKDMPQTIAYCDTAKKAAAMLYVLRGVIEERYKTLAEKRKKKWTDEEGSQIYIVIDEYAELVTTARKMVEPQLISIAQIGRAAGVHIILCTQRPTRDIITGAVKVNFDCRIALRTATAQDSRNIIDRNGAEKLPRYGEALVLKGADLEHWKVTITDPALVKREIDTWIEQAKSLGRTNHRPLAWLPENFCECVGIC